MEELIFAGNKYISSKRAAKLTGYTTDYLGQMCRGDKMNCRLVGRNWYINERSISEQKKFLKKKKTDDIGEIKYKKIELEPMYYSNDERVVNPKIDKTVKDQEENPVEKEEIREDVVPVRIIKRPEVATRTFKHRPVKTRMVERRVIRRQPIVPQQIKKGFPIATSIASIFILTGVLLIAGTFMLEQVMHYSSADETDVKTDIQLANVQEIFNSDTVKKLFDFK